jgi:multiple sugar transport system substrate-binding protein
MAQEMLAQFHVEHPHIRVFYTPDPEDFEAKVLADMRAGTAADVFQGCCTAFPIWAQMGHTLDLTPYIEADLDAETLADWDAAQYRALSAPDGAQYGLPKYHGALALYFNKDIFDAYGVAYPDVTWDHEDYYQAMRALSHDRDGDGQRDLWGSMFTIDWDRIQVHVNGWGGHMVDPDDPNGCALVDPPALEAMEWLRACMWDEHIMATPLDVRNLKPHQAFVAGQVAMIEDGSWSLKDILSHADFRVGVAPFPAGPARRVTLASTDAFGIYSGTAHPDEAWELLKFLTSKEYGRAMAQANLLQPARASLVNDWSSFVRQQYPGKTGDMNLAAFAEGQFQGYSVTAEIHPRMAEIRGMIYDAWDRIYTLGQADVSLMQDICDHLQQTPPSRRDVP